MLMLFRIVVLAVVFCSATSAAYAQDEGTVLRLIVTDSLNRIKRGTGFVVHGHNYIITAYHVVQDAKNIAIDRPQSVVTNELEVLSISPDWDIARLRLPAWLGAKVVPFRSGRVSDPASKLPTTPITLLGYGSVLDQLQRYTGYQENAPYVLSQDWNRPADVPGNSKYLFNLSGIKLMMLQAPIPYGVSGGPVTNAAGEAIGVISGALTRLENLTSLGWAIPIEYALQGVPNLQGTRAADIQWPALKLVTDKDIYMRAFGGPQLNLVGNLRCPDSIKAIETAWERMVSATSELEGYLRSARVSVDIGARQASSREAANNVIQAQVSILTERWSRLREGTTAYNREIGVANQRCSRDVDSIKQAMDGLPNTENNRRVRAGTKQLADKVVSDTNAKTQRLMVQTQYELEKQWAKISSIAPLSDKGSSFLSRPSKSIESDIHVFVQYVDALEYMIQNLYSGTYKDVNRELESVLSSYLLWIESTNRQPWDRG